MTDRLRAAVIPTRDRREDFRDCLRALLPQIDLLAVVDHGSDYARDVAAEQAGLTDADIHVLPYAYTVPNISQMWNFGLDYVALRARALGAAYDVAVLNDDVILPPDWFECVTGAMRLGDCAAGAVYRPFDYRMAGYAFVLDGDAGIRADEQFQWWYGDDDIARQAHARGGVALAGCEDVEHRHPNSTTVGRLREIADQDRLRFLAKWGQDSL